MATLASVVTLMEAKVEALTGTPVQMTNSDYASLQDAVQTAGTSRYQIQHQYQRRRDQESNSSHDSVAIEVHIHHKLTSATSERAYTEADMHAQQLAMLDKTWWEVAGVRQVSGGPEIGANVSRAGNIISWSTQAELQLTNA